MALVAAPAMAADYDFASTPSGTMLSPGDTITYRGSQWANMNASIMGAYDCTYGDGFAPLGSGGSAANGGTATTGVPHNYTDHGYHSVRVSVGGTSKCFGLTYPTYTGTLPTFSYTGMLMAESTINMSYTGALPSGATLQYRLSNWYSWLNGGVQYYSQNESSHWIHPARTGESMAIDAVIRIPGYADAIVPVVPKGVVLPAEFNDFSVSIAGSGQAGEKLTASAGSVTPAPASTSYSWKFDGDTDPRSASADFTPTLADIGETVTVSVTAAATGGTPPDKTRTATIAVVPGAGFTGIKKVGSTLTAVGDHVFSFSSFADPSCTTGESVLGGSPLTLTPATAGTYLKLTDTSASVSGTCEGPVAAGTYDSFTAATYTGSAQVGKTVTAADPSGLPDGASVAYSWKLDDVEVSTAPAYALLQADAAKSLTLTLTVSQDGYETKTLTSSPAAVVARGQFDVSAFSLTDSTLGTAPTTGDVLTASVDPAKVPSDTELTYSWGHYSNSECVALSPAATAAAYTVMNSDAGAMLCVVVGAKALGYHDTHLRLTAPATSLGTFTAPAVGFDAAPQVGVESTPVLTGLVPTAGVTYAYVWKVDGTQVATTASYTPVQSDVGKSITVTVTSSKADFVDDVSSSDATTTVKKGVFADMPVPVITGNAKVGQTLTRTSVTLPSTPAGLAVSYGWGLQTIEESDCLAIGNATPTLTLARESRGQKVCVLVTYSAPGYATKTFTSTLVGPIDGADLTVWRPVIDDTTPEVGETLTASVSSEGYPADSEVTFTWGVKVVDEDDNDSCQTGTSTGSSYVVTAADGGEQLCVVASVTSDGYNPGASVSRYTAAVAKARMQGVSVAIDDTTPTVGDSLTATVSGAPSGATVAYAWGVRTAVTNESDEEVSVTCETGEGATTRSLSVAPTMVGLRLCVVATVTADGFEDETLTSDFTTAVAKAAMTGLDVTITYPGEGSVPAFEDELTASLDGAPSGATVSWAWGTLADGECVVPAGDPASSSAHTVSASEVGKKLCVRAYVSATGYEDGSASESTDTVTGKAFTAAAVTGGGSATVGVESTLVETSTPYTDAVSYAWTIGSGEDSEVVSSSAEWTPSAADVGQTYSWSVTLEKPGYVAEVLTGTGTVAKGTFAAPAVTVAPALKVGESSTVSASLAGLPEGVDVAWQWFLVGVDGGDDTAIEEATSASYTPTADLAGKEVYAKGTFTAPGYEDATRGSSEQAVVKGAFAAPAVTVSPAPKVGLASTASAPLAGLPDGVEVSWQWFVVGVDGADDTAISGASSASYAPTADLAGEEVYAVGTFTAPGFEDATGTSSEQTVAKGSLTAPVVSIDDTTPRLGDTLTASSDLGGLPDGATVSYQWGVKAGTSCEVLEDATGETFTVADDNTNVGVVYCVVATFSAVGYDTATSSGATGATGGGQISHPGMVVLNGKMMLKSPMLARPVTATLLGGVHPAGAVVSWKTVVVSATAECRFTGAGVRAGDRYTPRVADLGRKVCAQATITAPGYDPAVVSNVSGLVTERARAVLADRSIVRGQRVRITGYGLTPGAPYTISAYRIGTRFEVVLTGIAPSNGRITRSFVYPGSTPTSKKRWVHITQPGGYYQYDTLTYTR